MSDIVKVFLTAWTVVGFAGGLQASFNAYTSTGVSGYILAGIVLGPFSVLLGKFRP